MAKAVLIKENISLGTGLQFQRHNALSCWGAGQHARHWKWLRELHPDPKAKGVTGETGAHPRDTLPTSTARRPHLLILSHIFLAGLSIQIYESVEAFLIQTTLWYCRYPSFFPKVGPVITTPP